VVTIYSTCCNIQSTDLLPTQCTCVVRSAVPVYSLSGFAFATRTHDVNWEVETEVLYVVYVKFTGVRKTIEDFALCRLDWWLELSATDHLDASFRGKPETALWFQVVMHACHSCCPLVLN
jgi:hypothetical protein